MIKSGLNNKMIDLAPYFSGYNKNPQWPRLEDLQYPSFGKPRSLRHNGPSTPDYQSNQASLLSNDWNHGEQARFQL